MIRASQQNDSSATTSIRVSEIFGPTIQGEGPAAGRRAFFVRLAGCPVQCTWCDTRYSWDSSAIVAQPRPRYVPILDLVSEVMSATRRSDIVVITGGEPLAQPKALAQFVRELRGHSRATHLETAGMPNVDPGIFDLFDLIVVSPKLRNAGPRAHAHMRTADYKSLARVPNAWFKFVAQSAADLDEIDEYESVLELERIMVMAEGTHPTRSLSALRDLADAVIDRGWSLSPRLHIWLWGDQPGR